MMSEKVFCVLCCLIVVFISSISANGIITSPTNQSAGLAEITAFTAPFLHLLSNGQKSYYIGTIFKGNYYRAQQFCVYHGMQLLSITSQEENDFIQKSLSDQGMAGEEFWTSGAKYADGVKWVWMSNGRPLTYTNWAKREPNNYKSREGCLELYWVNRKMMWNDSSCMGQSYFICEVTWPKDWFKLFEALTNKPKCS